MTIAMDEKLSFDYIALSDAEEKLLLQIKRQSLPDVVSGDSLERLFRHNLVANTMRVEVSETDSRVYLKAVAITEYGKDYLAYVQKMKLDKKKNLRQSILLTVLSAVLGALLSQPMWTFLNSLFT